MKTYITFFLLIAGLLPLSLCCVQADVQPEPTEHSRPGMGTGSLRGEEIREQVEKDLNMVREQLAGAEIGELRGAGSNLAGARIARRGAGRGNLFAGEFTPSSGYGFDMMEGMRDFVLLVPNASLTKEKADEQSEDLQVMTMVLKEAVDPVTLTGTMHRHHLILPGFGFSEMPMSRAIWLDGYGVLITLAVDFPLIPNEEDIHMQTHQPPDNGDQVWQRSKRRLKGMDELEDEPDVKVMVFDPDKVAQLQKKVIEAMKHASNIRNLGDKDRLVIVIRSYIEGEFLNRQAKKDLELDVFDPVIVPQSVMTLQAEKQDIDAFAEGKINAEAFQKKVTIVVY